MRSVSFLFLLVPFAAHAAPDCLDGYYDLGPRAAALGFECNPDTAPPVPARIVFCARKPLLEKGLCTGQGMPVSCRPEGEAWRCEEGGNYPFLATITKLNETTISYEFKSSFNEGSLRGTKL